MGRARRFTQKIQGRIVVDTRLLSAFKEAKYKLNVKGEIPLIQTEVVTSPSIFGLFRPRLLIPVGVLEEFNSEQLNHVFVHELFHYKRKDVLVNWLTQGLLILHWFNPILWYTFYKLREDQEIACDAITLNHIDINDSKEYAALDELKKISESITVSVDTPPTDIYIDKKFKRYIRFRVPRSSSYKAIKII